MNKVIDYFKDCIDSRDEIYVIIESRVYFVK